MLDTLPETEVHWLSGPTEFVTQARIKFFNGCFIREAIIVKTLIVMLLQKNVYVELLIDVVNLKLL